MRLRMRHAIGITAASLLVFTTAAAQSNLGWTWSKPLVLPSERGAGYFSSSSQSRFTQPLFGSRSSASSFSRYNPNYGLVSSSLPSLPPAPTPGNGGFQARMPNGSDVVTFDDLQRYHQEVIRPLEERLALMMDETRALCEQGMNAQAAGFNRTSIGQ
jgi:hypothetical protein